MTKITVFSTSQGRVSVWRSTCPNCPEWLPSEIKKVQIQRIAEEHAKNAHNWEAVIAFRGERKT